MRNYHGEIELDGYIKRSAQKRSSSAVTLSLSCFMIAADSLHDAKSI